MSKSKLKSNSNSLFVVEQRSSGALNIHQIEHLILVHLFNQARPMSEKEIQRAVGVRKQLFVAALRNLYRKRRIRRLGLGTNRCCYLYFVCGSCLQRAAKKRGYNRGRL